ncbi:hypothetical protein [Microcoleus sp. MON1_C1]|uniref:hypothetical protein n=1 Tax=Microcoleus sp. MON1_C1 TaxID=2818827 RepID=UPI00404092A5
MKLSKKESVELLRVKMDKDSIKITTEQDFRWKVFSDEVKELSAVESHIFLSEMMRQNMIKDNVIKGLLGVKPSEREQLL